MPPKPHGYLPQKIFSLMTMRLNGRTGERKIHSITTAGYKLYWPPSMGKKKQKIRPSSLRANEPPITASGHMAEA